MNLRPSSISCVRNPLFPHNQITFDYMEESLKGSPVALLKELDALNAVVCVLSHNYARGNDNAEIAHYPAKFLGDGELPNIIVVGSTNGNSRRAGSSMMSDWMTTYAP